MTLYFWTLSETVINIQFCLVTRKMLNKIEDNSFEKYKEKKLKHNKRNISWKKRLSFT